MKIGVMFGNPETTTGGHALKFYASVRLDVRGLGNVKEDDQVIGRETRVKVVKNKIAPPFRQTEFRMLFGQGIDFTGDILDLAVEAKIITKAGTWYDYNGGKLENGRAKVITYLNDNPSLLEEITARIREIYFGDNPPVLAVKKGRMPGIGEDADEIPAEE